MSAPRLRSRGAPEVAACELHASVGTVDSGVWHELAAPDRNPLMDPRFVRTVEVALGDRAGLWSAVFRDADGRPEACACLSRYEVDLTTLAGARTQSAVAWLRRLFPDTLRVPVVFCGLPVSLGANCLGLRPDIDARPVLRSLDRVLVQLARRERAPLVVLKEFDGRACTALEPLLDLGYQRIESLPTNVHLPQHEDFEAFRAAVKARTRYTIRRSQRKFARSQIRVLRRRGGDLGQLYTDEVHALYEQVLERAAHRLEVLPASFFRELARRMPDASRFTFFVREERTVAFSVALSTGVVDHQLFMGMDYGVNRPWDLYFNLMFDALDRSLRRRPERIVFGQTTDEFKREKLGCRSHPLALYVKSRHPAVSALTRWGGAFLFPEMSR